MNLRLGRLDRANASAVYTRATGQTGAVESSDPLMQREARSALGQLRHFVYANFPWLGGRHVTN